MSSYSYLILNSFQKQKKVITFFHVGKFLIAENVVEKRVGREINYITFFLLKAFTTRDRKLK